MRRFRLLALLCAVLLTISFAACGKGQSAGKAVDPKALADELLKALEPQGETIEATGEVAANYYAIGDEVQAYRIYLSTMYIAEEAAVFQVADAGRVDAVKKMCETRIQDLKESFDGYLPEEYQTVSDNAVVLAEGDIVAMVVGTAEGVAAAKTVFEAAFK